MQFIPHGPDVPECLLQAHEDNRVVFFCGAGISYPAGLRGFDWLVCELFKKLGVKPDVQQRGAIKAKRYDEAISLLEKDYFGGQGRPVVRRKLAEVLKPDLGRPKATTTHLALLTLARNRAGRTHLITTNFDRLFEEVVQRRGLRLERFQAPFVPLPKNRWDGLVYLHGLLPATEEPTENELDRLVLSSGDFGLAYLNEGWAARFVSELFRRYTVCFVGYSLSDPVLRYMTDALAADRLLDEKTPELFAFDCAAPDAETAAAGRWREKQIIPILYREHRLLHRSLQVWASLYRDGSVGKARIVGRYASKSPSASNSENDFVGRLLWALADPSGIPARRFAELDLVPSLDWLDVLAGARFKYEDLPRFGVLPPTKKGDDEPTFSLLDRPAPPDKAPRMALVGHGDEVCQWDNIMPHLARWLTRHLDNPKLLLWLAGQGGQLHPAFARLVEDELHRVQVPMMRKLWQMMLAGWVKPRSPNHVLYLWRFSFERSGLTLALRFQLRELLRPSIRLLSQSHLGLWDKVLGQSPAGDDPIHWRVELSTQDVLEVFKPIWESPKWKEALPDLLTDFTSLLQDALDLMRELGRAGERSDPSGEEKPSIYDRPLGIEAGCWTLLIDFVRDAWLALRERSPDQARLAAHGWWQLRYPAFKRLVFYAAAHGDCVPPSQGLDWLLADERRWLWVADTEREVVALLGILAPKLKLTEQARLESAILQGPPDSSFTATAQQEQREWAIYLRLSKLAESGMSLGPEACRELEVLAERHPDYPREVRVYRAEKIIQAGQTVVIGEEPKIFTPRRRRELVAYLERHPTMFHSPDRTRYDDWYQRCEKHLPTVACVLHELAGRGVWPTERWCDALNIWSNVPRHALRAWRLLAPQLEHMPEDRFAKLLHPVAHWFSKIAGSLVYHEAIFFKLVRRILDLSPAGAKPDGDLLNWAINHPIGLATEALFDWWGQKGLADGQGLPTELRSIFSELCDVSVEKYRAAHVVLAGNLLLLFRVDQAWTEQHPLPLFSWQQDATEALAVWIGFLPYARIHPPLWERLKGDFLETTRHFRELGRLDKHYAALLAWASLEMRDLFQENELAEAMNVLPDQAKVQVAEALVEALDSAGDQRAEYWENRVRPYLNSTIWPKSNEVRTPEMSECMARLCVAAGKAFPTALDELRVWLQPLKHHGHVVYRLHQAGLCPQFPEETLEFLSLITDRDSPVWPSPTLKECLDSIAQTRSDLRNAPRYQELSRYLARFG